MNDPKIFKALTFILFFSIYGCSVEKGMVVAPAFYEHVSKNNSKYEVIPEIVISHRHFFHPYYRGQSINVSYSNVGVYWNTSMKSIMVKSGTWEFYQFPDFKGEKVVLEPGYYPDEMTLKALGGNIGSFRFLYNWANALSRCLCPFQQVFITRIRNEKGKHLKFKRGNFPY